MKLISSFIAVLALAICGCRQPGATSTVPVTGAATGYAFVRVETNGVLYVGSTAIDPVKTAAVLKVGTKYGALAVIEHDENSRAYFQLAAATIQALIADGKYTPADITNALSNISVAALRSPAAASAFSDALELYTVTFNDLLAAKLDDLSPYTVPLLKGLADGAQEAVNLTTPAQ